MDDVIPFNKQEIIDANEKEITERLLKNPTSAEAISVAEDRLDEVLKIVENIGNSLEFSDKIITKAAYFLGALAWAQPFSGGNKSTGFLMTIVFLHDNGFELRIPEIDEAYLIDLLYKIQEERTNLSHEIIERLILYIKERIVRI